MDNERERYNLFWRKFDRLFNPNLRQVADEVIDAYLAIGNGNLDLPLDSWRKHRRLHTYPQGFQQDMMAIRDPLLFLSAKQVEPLDEEFADDLDAERTAFELFGQGVLFDAEERPDGDRIHKMDSDNRPPGGYHRWHAIIRAAVMVGADADRWLQINRHVGLAWAIQSEARPVNDAPDNPGLAPARLAELRSSWQALSFDELDSKFDSTPYPPGIEGPETDQLARSGYDEMLIRQQATRGRSQSEGE